MPAGLLGHPVDSARRHGLTFFKRQSEAPQHAPDRENRDRQAEPFADFPGGAVGMFGDELPNAAGLGREFGSGPAAAAGGSQRSGFAVALDEPANERRADGKSFGDLRGRLASLASLENADAKVV